DLEAEMGLPLWQFGMRTFAFQDKGRIIATLCEQGMWRLVKICANTGEVEPIASPYNSFTSLVANEKSVAVIAAGSERSDEVVTIDLGSGQLREHLEGHDLPVDKSWISVAQPISFSASHGEQAHGFYYPPTNPHVTGDEDEAPPLLVMTHGGPTGATTASINLKTQFWTSRGFAVLDVNYRGSTGYGRAYRERLKGQWGIYDVEDAVAGANYLVAQGKADPERLAIRGGSAGGYTTLAALTFTDTFHAGASYYGIGDLESLARDTHKFEARYLDGLVGKYPQQREIYEARSPLNHVEQLSCPVIFMQGEEDRVVPPQQAEQMAAALRAKGIEVELLMFAGEQHGFRRAETIVQTLESELVFYARVFNFDLAGGISP
ncbi:MAG: S9 family peptidase, partial [Gammaproteobacteria bacterium]|nr:S9 family peptidase [Gammaproteobacteria bacterium]